jgi:hypothetical protein
MALVTERWIDVGGELLCDVRFDDVDGSLEWVRVQNLSSDVTYTVEFVRGNGQHWREAQVPPGFDTTWNAGGPIPNLSDIPEFRTGVA